MKLWSGIITDKLEASRDFYLRVLNADIIFESEWFVLMEVGSNQLALMLPNLENQAPMFQAALQGPGMWFGIDVENVDEHYQRIQTLGIEVALTIRDEPWGDRHFTVLDPNGIGIDFVKHCPPA